VTQTRIFITGASGCVGHYLVEALIQQTDHELFLLVRNPAKLRVDCQARPGITVLQGDMGEIDRFAELLTTIDVAVLTATAWGGPEETYDINVVKTLRLMELLDPQRCRQIIYFSTESILDRDNQPLPQAAELGSDYIKTKYACFQKIQDLAIAPKITVLFPTLVFGGDGVKPYSHLTSGLPDVVRWLWLIRFISLEGSFHFVHGADIAQVVCCLIDRPPPLGDRPSQMVLGSAAITADQLIESACRYFGKRIYFRIRLNFWLADLIIWLFRIQMSSWDRFCFDYRHFVHRDPVNPGRFGLRTQGETMEDIFQLSPQVAKPIGGAAKGRSKTKV
jgi:nucleoside-diphosphate-sugar epimerase